MAHAILDSTGKVVNVIQWDGVKPWAPPTDHTVVEILAGTGVGVGWTRAGDQFMPPVTTLRAAAPIRVQARRALPGTDATMLRVAEAVALGQATWAAPDVAAWATYRRALRAIANGSDKVSTALPTKPPYPVGT